MSDSYALRHSHPDGGERIQEFDSLKEALHFQLHNGGVLVRRQSLPGQPGLWWVEVPQVPPLEDDRVAMMLGLVPDKRTPEERLYDAIRTNGESLRYHYDE